MAKRILLVEDNEEVREALEDFLQHDGHTVVSASDGEEAWRFLQCGERFDLIMSDYRMPKMSGLELLRRVRAEYEMRFLLLSGNHTVSGEDPTPLAEVCAKFGATFVSKPPDFSVIARLLGDS